MKHLLRLNEYVQELLVKPKLDKMLSKPMSAEMMLKRIAERYNSLISKSSSESLEDNLGLSDDFLRNLKGQFEPEDINSAMQDNQDILALLSSIRQTEQEMSEEDKKEKAMEIVEDIFKGKGFDLDKLEFKLDILNDEDLMDAKSNIIGVSPEEFKETKREIERENPKLKKELDVRAIQNALTQGFASSIKDDFVTGDTEIEGVSFGDYYSLMDKTFKLYSKIPKELMHEVMTQSPALGRVELKWDEDKKKYVIHASGYTILILVHEMVKGILELISLHRDPELEPEDEQKMMALSGTQYSEREGLQYGPGMVNKFKEFFNKVEDNLIEQREIREKNPAMMLNLLSRFYRLEDDLFLRACKAIFSDDENKPYDLFEEFYLDGLSGQGFRRGGSDLPSDDDGPSEGPSGGLGDDALRDLLSGAGISLNMDPDYPVSEAAKYVIAFNTFSILESKKDLLDKWSSEGGRDRATVVQYIDIFGRLANNPKGELAELLVSNIPGVKVDNNLNDRMNIEKYSFNELKALVDFIIKRIRTPKVSSLKPGDINQAILQIQRSLGLQQTGFYDKELEDAVRKFQQDFKSGFSTDYDWEELSNKLTKSGLVSLKPIERIQLAKSAEFISAADKLIEDKEKELKEKIKLNSKETDPVEKSKIEDLIVVEFNKLSDIKKDLKEIKSVLSGGIEKPSGKLDPATISAFMYSKGIEKLEGLGGVGTLAPSGGEVIEENENYKVYRVLSRNFCVETRKQFDKVLKQLGSGESVYNWCISWGGEGTYYRQHRTSARDKQTIYFIENLKRSSYEFDKWEQFKNQGGDIYVTGGNRSLGYLRWRLANGTPKMSRTDAEAIEGEGNRKFYDNYHIAVIFATNKQNQGKNSFWLVGASNNGQWGDQGNHFTFKEVAAKIWPSSEDQSKRRNTKSSSGGGTIYPTIQVPQEIIDQPWYTIPSEREMEKLENDLLLPMDLSSLERNEGGNLQRMLNNKNISVNDFKNLSFEDKEKWIGNHYFSNTAVNNFIEARNMNPIPEKIWEVLPNELRAAYIRQTIGATLTPKMIDEIRDNNSLMKSYQDFIKRRLVGEGGSGGILDKMKSVNKIADLKKIALTDQDLEFASMPYDFYKIKNQFEKLRKEIDELSPDTKMSKRTAMLKQLKSMDIKMKQYVNLVGKYTDSLRQALENIKKENPRDVTDSASGASYFNEQKKLLNLSKIYHSANSLMDANTKAGLLFADVLSKDPGLNMISTDWKKVPTDEIKFLINARSKANQELKSSDQSDTVTVNKLKKKVKTYNSLLNKLICLLLVNGGKPSDYSSSEFKDYLDQITNVSNYIKSLEGSDESVIKTFVSYFMTYYDLIKAMKTVKASDGKKIGSIYDSLLNTFPSLERQYGFKSSDSLISKLPKKESGNKRTAHRETLG